MRGKVRLVFASTLAVAVLGACGGDSQSSTPTTLKPRPKLTRPQQQKLVDGAVLNAYDAPEGFTAEPHDSSDPELPEQAIQQFAECTGADSSIFGTSATRVQADGVDFVNPAGDQISNSIELAASAAEAIEEFELLASDTTPRCMAVLYDAAFKADPIPGAKVGKVTAEPFDVNGVGDRAIGYRVTVPVTGPVRSETVIQDIVFAQYGRAEITVDVLTTGTADRVVSNILANKMVNRLGEPAP